MKQIAARASKNTNDVHVINRTANLTIGAAPFMGGTAILQVTNNAVRVLEPGQLHLFFLQIVL